MRLSNNEFRPQHWARRKTSRLNQPADETLLLIERNISSVLTAQWTLRSSRPSCGTLVQYAVQIGYRPPTVTNFPILLRGFLPQPSNCGPKCLREGRREGKRIAVSVDCAPPTAVLRKSFTIAHSLNASAGGATSGFAGLAHCDSEGE